MFAAGMLLMRRTATSSIEGISSTKDIDHVSSPTVMSIDECFGTERERTIRALGKILWGVPYTDRLNAYRTARYSFRGTVLCTLSEVLYGVTYGKGVVSTWTHWPL